MSSTFISPGSIPKVPPVPNQKEPLLEADPTTKIPPGYVPKLSLRWYEFVNRLHAILLTITTTFPSLITNENGANNAIAFPANSAPALEVGTVYQIKLAHTLQAGPNTLAANGSSTAMSIKSHRNPANDIATPYVVGAIIAVIYDGTVFQDLSQ